jgi:hypothetical protein
MWQQGTAMKEIAVLMLIVGPVSWLRCLFLAIAALLPQSHGVVLHCCVITGPKRRPLAPVEATN